MHSDLCTSGRWQWRAALVSVLLSLFICCGCDSRDERASNDNGATETITSLRAQLRTNLNDSQLRLRLARLYLQNNDGAAAESHLRRALKLGTDDSEVQLDLLRSLMLQNNHYEAYEFSKTLVTAAGAKPSARLWMLHGEAQQGIKSFSEIKIRDSFINAFRALSSIPDSVTGQRLVQLSEQHSIVAAARDHANCSFQDVLLVDPPTTVSGSRSGRVLQVGPTRDLKVPSDAAKIAQDGDLIEIDAGIYRGDATSWYQNDITLRGVGGIAYLEAAGQHTRDLGIWVFEGNDITAENIGFSGAKVKHQNGAGIRLHGRGVTIRNCHFRNNENGILGGSVADNDVLVEFSTFVNNGYGDGQSHNLYIGRARSFTMRYSYSQGAHVGHLVKSRAYKNVLLFNRFVDGEEGDSSYVINFPEGGQAWVIGNELQQGPNTQNAVMISFGEESADHIDQSLFVVNNTFYNRVLNGTFVRNSTKIDAQVINNIFAGAPGFVLVGPGVSTTNLSRPGPWFVDSHEFDFTLTSAAPAIDGGTELANIEGLSYLPDAEYRHPARGQIRQSIGTIDMGAREFCGL